MSNTIIVYNPHINNILETIRAKELVKIKELVDTRLIWPSRPKVIYTQYIAKKKAWLAAYPTIQSSKYPIARGLKN